MLVAMRLVFSVALSLVLPLALACGSVDDGSKGTPVALSELVGNWCGVQGDPACRGDEAMWLELRADGSKLSGQMCENPGKDCNPLTSAEIEGNHLMFSYTFGGGISHVPGPVLPDGGVGEAGPPIVEPGSRVDGHFTVQESTMTGSLFSTKCNCSQAFTLYKQ